MVANIMYCSFSMLPCSFLAVASLLGFFDPYATAKKAKEDLEDTQMWMLAFFLFLVSHHYSSSTTTAAAWWVASAALATSVGRYAVGKKKGVGVVSMIGWLLSSAVLLGSSLVPLGLIVFIIRGTRPPPHLTLSGSRFLTCFRCLAGGYLNWMAELDLLHILFHFDLGRTFFLPSC